MCCRIPNKDDTETSQSGQWNIEVVVELVVEVVEEVESSGVKGSRLIVRSRVLVSAEPCLKKKFPEPPVTPSAKPTTAAVSIFIHI